MKIQLIIIKFIDDYFNFNINLKSFTYITTLLFFSFFAVSFFFLTIGIETNNTPLMFAGMLIMTMIISRTYNYFQKNYSNPPLLLLLSIMVQIFTGIILSLITILLITNNNMHFERSISIISFLLTILSFMFAIISSNFSTLKKYDIKALNKRGHIILFKYKMHKSNVKSSSKIKRNRRFIYKK